MQVAVTCRPFPLVWLLLSAAGCHWVAGNPDVDLNSDFAWQGGSLPSSVRDQNFVPTVWVRVSSSEPNSAGSGNEVGVLSSRVRQAFLADDWQVVDERAQAAVWLDLDIRYWGINPVRDQAASTYDKVVRAQRPQYFGAGESAHPGEYGSRAFLTPVTATISRYSASVVEFDLVLDIHLKRGAMEGKRTLVVWARRIDLQEQDAALAISERVLEALREVM